MCALFEPQTRKQWSLSGGPAPKNKESGPEVWYCQTSEDLALPKPNLLWKWKWKHAAGAARGAIFLIVPETYCWHSTTVCRGLQLSVWLNVWDLSLLLAMSCWELCWLKQGNPASYLKSPKSPKPLKLKKQNYNPNFHPSAMLWSNIESNPNSTLFASLVEEWENPGGQTEDRGKCF